MLSAKQFSLTRPRLLIFESLVKNDKPVSLPDLCQSVQGIDRASVYRTVSLFEELAIVHRVWTGFKSKIELSEAFSPHHHHFTCNDCKQTTALDSEGLETSLHDLEAAMGFKLTQHSVELKGSCSSCLRK